MGERRVWDCDADHAQLSAGDVFYTYSRGAASPANIGSMVRNLAEFTRRSERPLGYILHVADSARPPSMADGARVTEMFNKHAPRLAGVALVVEASGFSGAALRSAMSMVFILKRDGFPVRTFAQLVDAATWLGQLLHVPSTEITALGARGRALLTREPAIASRP